MALRATVRGWTIETDTATEMMELLRQARVLDSEAEACPSSAPQLTETQAVSSEPSEVAPAEEVTSDDDGLPRGQLKAMVHGIMERSQFPLRIIEVKDLIHRTHPEVPYYSIRTILQRGVDAGIYGRDGDGYFLIRTPVEPVPSAELPYDE